MPLPVDVLDNWLDYSALAFSFLAAVGTLAAVWVSVQTARTARSQTLAAERAAAEAMERSIAAQLQASEVVASTERELEQSRQRVTRRAATEEKAIRQAGDITVVSLWDHFEDGREISGDLHAFIGARVVNPTTSPITQLELTWSRVSNLPGVAIDNEEPSHMGSRELLEAGDEFTFRAMQYVCGHAFGGPLDFTLRFTDQYLDRWELTPDRALYLLTPRLIDIKESAELLVQ